MTKRRNWYHVPVDSAVGNDMPVIKQTLSDGEERRKSSDSKYGYVSKGGIYCSDRRNKRREDRRTAIYRDALGYVPGRKSLCNCEKCRVTDALVADLRKPS